MGWVRKSNRTLKINSRDRDGRSISRRGRIPRVILLRWSPATSVSRKSAWFSRLFRTENHMRHDAPDRPLQKSQASVEIDHIDELYELFGPGNTQQLIYLINLRNVTTEHSTAPLLIDPRGVCTSDTKADSLPPLFTTHNPSTLPKLEHLAHPPSSWHSAVSSAAHPQTTPPNPPQPTTPSLHHHPHPHSATHPPPL